MLGTAGEVRVNSLVKFPYKHTNVGQQAKTNLHLCGHWMLSKEPTKHDGW